MKASGDLERRRPRYHIEPAGFGYAVVGEHVWVWEDNLAEARSSLEELEVRRPLESAPLHAAVSPRPPLEDGR